MAFMVATRSPPDLPPVRKGGFVTVDISAAAALLAGSARAPDRRRFDLLFGDGDAAALLAAVDGYRNPDRG
jgi:hypothetical protein